MPPEASRIICENLEWSTLNSLVGQIQCIYPNISATQVHAAWTTMLEELWKRDIDQLKSTKALLEELADDVEVWDVARDNGVEQLCFGMKKIARSLCDQVVEIALDATCEFDWIQEY